MNNNFTILDSRYRNNTYKKKVVKVLIIKILIPYRMQKKNQLNWDFLIVCQPCAQVLVQRLHWKLCIRQEIGSNLATDIPQQQHYDILVLCLLTFSRFYTVFGVLIVDFEHILVSNTVSFISPSTNDVSSWNTR